MFRFTRPFLAHNVLSTSIGIVSLCFFSLAQPQEFNNGTQFVDAEKTIVAQHSVLKRAYKQTDIPLQIILSPVTQEEKAALASRTKKQPLKIGFRRAVPSPYNEDLKPLLTWIVDPEGGHTAVFTVTSPGARAIRLALAVPHMDKGIEMRFFETSMDQVFGPFTTKEISSSKQINVGSYTADNTVSTKSQSEKFLYWSPVIQGETIGVEIYFPAGVDPQNFSILIPLVSHLITSALDIDEKDLSDIGESGNCNIDLACHSTTPRDLGDTVAKIIYTEFFGDSYLCTGTLLNDKEGGNFIPYFITANHCVSTQSVASTINSYWFFERSRCRGPAPTSVIQRTGGAELIRTGETSDFTFLQLNHTPPTGVFYAGWSSAALAIPSTVIGIHHPMGDLKKWSKGRATGFANYLQNVNGNGSHVRIIWSEGVTEPGSSGSGLFDIAGRFRGNLHGGDSSCSTRNQPDWYGRFDRTYPSIRRWLYLHPTTLSCGRTVNSSVQQRDSKEYKIVAPSAYSKLTISLSNLTKDADLYVRRNNRPTLNNYNCRPYRTGTRPESCVLNNSGNNTYYIRVRGYSSGSTGFAIKVTCSSQ